MKTYICLLLTFILTIGNGYCGSSSLEDLHSFYYPFAEDSLWKSRLISPIFDENLSLKALNPPIIHEGAFSSSIYMTNADDPKVKIYGVNNQPIQNPDSNSKELYIELPHWPSGVEGASGTDGHADIIDLENKRIYSFWKLRTNNGRWEAASFAWMPLNGSGWPDPAHYYQGVRAVSTPVTAGIIRKHEGCQSSDPIMHALALSLPRESLSSANPYVFPATTSDFNYKLNKGNVPEGSLLMLPNSFDSTSVENKLLSKVIEALKVYGAYVVDRNDSTSFAIYVENGSNIEDSCKWSNSRYSKILDDIRRNLRVVKGADVVLDAKGRQVSINKNLNLLSFRGPWYKTNQSSNWLFQTFTQKLELKTNKPNEIFTSTSNSLLKVVNWAIPNVGDQYELENTSCKGVDVKLIVVDSEDGKQEYGFVSPSQKISFYWTAKNFYTTLIIKVANAGSTCASAVLKKIP